jgi:hypothetical protein
MEPQGSSPHSQEPTTCPYPEPDQYNNALRKSPYMSNSLLPLCSLLKSVTFNVQPHRRQQLQIIVYQSTKNLSLQSADSIKITELPLPHPSQIPFPHRGNLNPSDST